MRKTFLRAALPLALALLLPLCSGCDVLRSVLESAVVAQGNSATDSTGVTGEAGGGEIGSRSANIAMLGRVAGSADRLLYADEAGRLILQTQEGTTTLYDGDAWFIHPLGEGAVFSNGYGEICAADGKGGVSLLRAAGSPLYLTLHEGYLYFLEDGLRRMDTRGENETLLIPGATGKQPFYIAGGWLYYEGEPGNIYRAALDGTDTVRMTDCPVRAFSVDEDFFFVRADSDNIIWGLREDGSLYKALEATAAFTGARFVAAQGRIYFSNEEDGGAVYSAPPGGEPTREAGPSSYFCVLDGDVHIPHMP